MSRVGTSVTGKADGRVATLLVAILVILLVIWFSTKTLSNCISNYSSKDLYIPKKTGHDITLRHLGNQPPVKTRVESVSQ